MMVVEIPAGMGRLTGWSQLPGHKIDNIEALDLLRVSGTTVD
jgi:hypothetical protein